MPRRKLTPYLLLVLPHRSVIFLVSSFEAPVLPGSVARRRSCAFSEVAPSRSTADFSHQFRGLEVARPGIALVPTRGKFGGRRSNFPGTIES